MYNVYVTNKSENVVYVRLKSQELSSLNVNFHQELHTLVSKGDVDESYIQTFLVRWGFRLIPPQETLSFATFEPSGNSGTLMYASLFAASQLWVMDEGVDFLKFGCLFVKSVPAPTSKIIFGLSQVNPVPVWFVECQGNRFPENTIKAFSGFNRGDHGEYFGRSMDGVPCTVVATSDNKCGFWNQANMDMKTSGYILQATGHHFYQVKSGDPLPPNAVVVGLSDSGGWLYLGRVEGRFGRKEPCSVSTENGKIKQFFYPNGKEERFESVVGEILVLTNDATS